MSLIAGVEMTDCTDEKCPMLGMTHQHGKHGVAMQPTIGRAPKCQACGSEVNDATETDCVNCSVPLPPHCHECGAAQ